jgi:hypothetical protein
MNSHRMIRRKSHSFRTDLGQKLKREWEGPSTLVLRTLRLLSRTQRLNKTRRLLKLRFFLWKPQSAADSNRNFFNQFRLTIHSRTEFMIRKKRILSPRSRRNLDS